jgi:hypothetical protein
MLFALESSASLRTLEGEFEGKPPSAPTSAGFFRLFLFVLTLVFLFVGGLALSILFFRAFVFVLVFVALCGGGLDA